MSIDAFAQGRELSKTRHLGVRIFDSGWIISACPRDSAEQARFAQISKPFAPKAV
jgi:hypothetical protein